MFARRRKTKQFREARLVRFAGGTIAIGRNPLRMLDAQSIVYLSLKLSVRGDLVGRSPKTLCFHVQRYRRRSDSRYFAYAGFSNTTCEVIGSISFEVGANFSLPQHCGEGVAMGTHPHTGAGSAPVEAAAKGAD
jgi:hypothetical protein